MSGLAAAIRWDGGPPPRTVLAAMIAASPHRALDGSSTWTGDGAALAKLHRFVFPEQTPSTQPAVEAGGPHVAVFDGRLDNRDALAVIFPALSASDDDAAYALAAAAGEPRASLESLEGDFAAVVWNSGRRSVTAIRDRMGMRPLFWTTHGGLLLLASDVRALVAGIGATPAVEEETVAAILNFEPPADARTLFRGINRLPPGHTLTASSSGIRAQRYWEPEAGPADEHRSDADYAEECRALLERATGASLRAKAPAVLFFSGGIDSSAVLAASLAVAHRGEARAPQAASIVYQQPEADERSYRDAFAEKYAIGIDEVAPGPVDAVDYFAEATASLHLPEFPGQIVARPLYARARALGARVALTGAGGDFLFSGSTFHYADLIRRGRLRAAVAQFRQDRVTEDSGWSASGLLTDGLWPNLPQRVRAILRVPARRLLRREQEQPWVRLRLPRRPVVPGPPRGVSHASWEICWGLRHGWTGYFLDAIERASTRFGLESRHPLLDPALVRFTLSLPERQRRQGRTTKVVLRQAADLPPAIHHRLTKADYGFEMGDAMRLLGGRTFFQRLQIAEAGWVDPDTAARSYDRTVRVSPLVDREGGALLPRLWMTAAVELWYRAVCGESRVRRRA